MSGANYVNIGAQPASDLSEAAVSVASAATTAIVSAVASKRVYAFKGILVAGAAATVTIADGTTGLLGTVVMAAGVPITFSYDGNPWFETSSGNALNLITNGTSQVSGRFYYIQG